MNILLIDSCLKDGLYMAGYLKSRGHQCEWFRKLDEFQLASDGLSGYNSARIPLTVSLKKYQLALVEGQLFASELGLQVAVNLAKAKIIRVAVGGVEGSTKLQKEGVIDFVVNRATFFLQIDEIMKQFGELVFESAREKSNRTLLTSAGDYIRRNVNRLRRRATK